MVVFGFPSTDKYCRGGIMKAHRAEEIPASDLKIEDLPTTPTVLTRILEVAEDTKSTVKDLERAILCDQSIAAKVLHLANSALYGFPGRITTMSKAIIVIGFSSVKSIAIQVSLFEAFQQGNEKSAEEIKATWVHALKVGYGAKTLATLLRSAKSNEAFVGGLLHDVGKAVLIHSDYERYRQVMDKAADNNRWDYHLVAERELLGRTHTQMGQALGLHWQLPKPYVACMGLHHSADPLHHGELVQIVSLANRLAHAESIPPEDVIPPSYSDALRLTRQEVEQTREMMSRYAGEMEALFNTT